MSVGLKKTLAVFWRAFYQAKLADNTALAGVSHPVTGEVLELMKPEGLLCCKLSPNEKYLA